MEPGTEGFCTIEEALDELRRGRMIVLVDDQQRENEGDLVIAAEKVTPEAINFMMRNACGISAWPCRRPSATASTSTRCPAATSTPRPRPGRRTSTPAPASPPASPPSTAPAPSQVAIDERIHAGRPGARQGPRADGLRAREGGVLVRAGHTEGSVDLARLAGFKEAAVICEIVDARRPHGPPARPAASSATSTA